MNLRQVYRVPQEKLRVYIFGAYFGGASHEIPTNYAWGKLWEWVLYKGGLFIVTGWGVFDTKG